MSTKLSTTISTALRLSRQATWTAAQRHPPALPTDVAAANWARSALADHLVQAIPALDGATHHTGRQRALQSLRRREARATGEPRLAVDLLKRLDHDRRLAFVEGRNVEHLGVHQPGWGFDLQVLAA